MGKPLSSWSYDATSLRTVIQVPTHDRRRPLSVTALAKGPIVALGPDHNRRLVRSDVKCLVGPQSAPGSDAADVLAWALDNASRPGFADAIARLGGPFVRFIEFSTLEEAGRSLGRVIIAAPVDPEEPFDAELLCTLERFGQREQRTLNYRGLRAAQIVDLPFAFDGRACPMRWEAEVGITWRSHTLRHHHRSQPLFPTIPAWSVLIWDQSEASDPLTRTRDGHAMSTASNRWKACAQAPGELSSLRQPHRIRFLRSFTSEVRSATSPVVYLATTVVSPTDKSAVLELGVGGAIDVFLNGQQVSLLPPIPEPGIVPFFRQLRRTQAVRLLEGENSLLLRSEPADQGPDGWFLVAAVLDDQGEPLVDIDFNPAVPGLGA